MDCQAISSHYDKKYNNVLGTITWIMKVYGFINP